MTTRTLLSRAVVGAALTALAVGGTAFGATAASAATQEPAAAPRASTPAADPAATPAVHPAATSTPPNPALAVRVANWVSRGGETQLTALGKDFGTLETAAKAADMGRMASGCGQLRTDVETAQAYAPIPDGTAQHEWSAALAAYDKGATDCVTGAKASNGTLITQAANEIMTGSASLDKVTARLNDIAGQ